MRNEPLSMEKLVPEPSSPFYFYNSSFDAQHIIMRYARSNIKPLDNHHVNYLGVHVATKFFPQSLNALEGKIEPIPIPANWHADIAEWGAALRAVDLSKNTFTVLELGCGWGCWMNITGAAARFTGRDVQLIGVEGDPSHIQYARESTKTNGFHPNQVTLEHGVASATAGTALFPVQTGGSWGLEPVFGASETEVASALALGSHEVVPMITLATATAKHARIDLLHIDIQGGEVDVIRGSIETINTKVAYILIGCHSRLIEGQLLETLLTEGWVLEIERPTIFSISADGSFNTTVDGVQGWRNPRIT